MAETFGALVRRLRLAGGLSAAQLARRMGITQVYLAEVEASRRPPFPVGGGRGGRDLYGALALHLGVARSELEAVAARERGELRFPLDGRSDPEIADLLALFDRWQKAGAG